MFDNRTGVVVHPSYVPELVSILQGALSGAPDRLLT